MLGSRASRRDKPSRGWAELDSVRQTVNLQLLGLAAVYATAWNVSLSNPYVHTYIHTYRIPYRISYRTYLFVYLFIYLSIYRVICEYRIYTLTYQLSCTEPTEN